MRTTKNKRALERVIWFEGIKQFDIDYFDLLQPRRVVSHERRYRSGLFWSAKCGRDIQYESALERDFAQQIEADRQVVFYWEQPVQISYRRGRHKHLYTPDYGIYLHDGRFVLAEVKDLAGMLDYRVQRKAEALMEFCCERGFGMLLTDGRNGPEKLLKPKINRKLERELLRALNGSVLKEDECRRIMKECKATPGELYKAVIRHNLSFRPFPLKLQRENDNRIFRKVFFERQKYETVIGEMIDRFPWKR